MVTLPLLVYPGWRLSSLELTSLTPGFFVKRLRRVKLRIQGVGNVQLQNSRVGYQKHPTSNSELPWLPNEQCRHE